VLALGLLLAATIGLALGLLGGGGSILTVPVLVYVLGVGAKPAIAMSLAIVGVTSLLGAALHRRLGNVRLDVAAVFGPIAMLGAYAGAKLAGLLSGETQLALLALVMVAAAVSMLRSARVEVDPSATPRIALLVPVGFGVGLLTGVVGIGGGFLIVPSLVVLARLPMRQGVGTSLLVIAMNSAAGLAGYLGAVPLDWAFLTRFTAAAALGALAGTALGARVPQATLKRGFAVFLLAVGGFVLYRSRGALHGVSHSHVPARTTPMRSTTTTAAR
jgi:uncharacterized membrane protein YfcA